MHNSWALADHTALGQTWDFTLPSAQDAPRNKGTFLLLKHWGLKNTLGSQSQWGS